MEKNRISSPSPQQTAVATPTQRSKPTTPVAPDSASGGTGGFLSLLSALGDSMDCLADDFIGGSVIDTSEILLVEEAPIDGVDSATLMAWLVSQTSQTSQTAQTSQTSQTAPTSAGHAVVDTADLGQGTSNLILTQGQALTGLQDKSLVSLQAELLPPGGLVAQTARLDGAADVRAQNNENSLPSPRRGFARVSNALSSGLAGVSTAALVAGQRSVTGNKPLASAALAAAPVLQTAPERRDAAAVGAGIPRTGSEFNPAPAQLGQAAVSVPDAFARSAADRAMPSGMTDVWGGGIAVPEPSQSLESSTVLAEPQQTAAEDALAEQVAFWVSENLQNAELTVTHDGKPVEVSVSMSGKEAHIVFGSDQSETRELLDASVAQLRDLLHSEGLILSGVTVGASGARNPNSDGGSDTPRGRQGTRQAQVLAPVAEMGSTRPRILTESAVDLFV